MRELIKRKAPTLVELVRWSRRIAERLNPHPPTPAQPMVEIFTEIYQTNYWGSPDSKSGNGSDLSQTEALRRKVPAALKTLGVRTVLDIPCGDFFWMSHCDLDLERYIGGDIIADLVTSLNKTYGDAQHEFRQLNLTLDPLPNVDLILCRDVLVHFSHADVRRSLRNMKESGSRYLLTTTFVRRDRNADIPTGQWRPLNLQKPPFSLPEPKLIIDEECTEGSGNFADKCLGLWELRDV